MDYEKLYLDFIEAARSGRRWENRHRYPDGLFEVHHITPVSFDESLKHDESNLVALSPVEHFLAHRLLFRAMLQKYPGTEYARKAACAVTAFDSFRDVPTRLHPLYDIYLDRCRADVLKARRYAFQFAAGRTVSETYGNGNSGKRRGRRISTHGKTAYDVAKPVAVPSSCRIGGNGAAKKLTAADWAGIALAIGGFLTMLYFLL